MYRLLLPLLLVLTACPKNDPAEGAVKLTVSYEGFLPRCVRVSAKDTERTGETRTTELAGKGSATGGSLTVAIFRDAAWGQTLELTAEAFEQATPAGSCTGQAAVRQSGTLTLASGVQTLTLELVGEDQDADGFLTVATGGRDCDDAKADVKPGASELCNTVDEDCDGDPVNGLEVGAACTGEGGCAGTRQCAENGAVLCSTPAPLTLYVDGDGDGFGQKNGEPQSLCEQPAGGYASNNTDCDDSNAQVRPGATERCNGLDDDCNETTDEGFNVGSLCTPADGCSGVTTCNTGEGTAFCQVVTPQTPWYPDEDLDTYGRADAGVMGCSAPGAGYIARGNDCDDGDPFTYTSARELCDLKDNDCDGNSEGTEVCPAGGASWASTTVGDSTRDWNRLSLWGDGGVWVSGDGDMRAQKSPGASAFVVMNAGCSTPSDWRGLWADPVSGQAYLGGLGDALGIQQASSSSCVSKPPTAKEETTGLKGFRDANGGVALYGVGAKPDGSGGWAFVWNGEAGVQSVAPVSDALFDVNGLSHEVLFAVGGPSNSPRIYRWSTSNTRWENENAPTSNMDRLLAVSVVHSKLAFAVGLDGSVLRWNGASWARIPFFNTSSDLSGVLAFGANSVYVTTQGGSVYRYDGQAWTKLTDFGTALYDIGGTSPEDLWVVGAGGRIAHWPQ